MILVNEFWWSEVLCFTVCQLCIALMFKKYEKNIFKWHVQMIFFNILKRVARKGYKRYEIFCEVKTIKHIIGKFLWNWSYTETLTRWHCSASSLFLVMLWLSIMMWKNPIIRLQHNTFWTSYIRQLKHYIAKDWSL